MILALAFIAVPWKTRKRGEAPKRDALVTITRQAVVRLQPASALTTRYGPLLTSFSMCPAHQGKSRGTSSQPAPCPPCKIGARRWTAPYKLLNVCRASGQVSEHIRHKPDVGTRLLAPWPSPHPPPLALPRRPAASPDPAHALFSILWIGAPRRRTLEESMCVVAM